MTPAAGKVTVAPNVLMSIVLMALREVPGIARLGNVPLARRSGRGEGVALRYADGGVSADCYVVAKLGTNLLELGMATQATVAAVIRELADMTVHEVNVFIQDVEAGYA